MRVPGGGQQLLAEPLGRDLVNLQQGLALGGAGPLFVVWLELGQRQAEALRQRFTASWKPDLLVQLEELDDVAAGLQPKQWKNPLSRLTCERGRLLAVERTQALVVRARSSSATRSPESRRRCRRDASGRR